MLASHVDPPLARHAIFLPQERLLKPRAHFFPFVCARPYHGSGLWMQWNFARLLSVRKCTNSDGITKVLPLR